MAKKKGDEEEDDFTLPGEDEEGQEDATEDDEDDEDSDDDDSEKLDEAEQWLARILDFANENTDHENADVAAFARQVALLAEGEGQGEDDHIDGDFTCHCGSEHDEE